MNRTYRLVWNRALRVIQVASEISSSSAAASGASPAGRVLQRHPLLLALVTAGLCITSSSAWAQTCQPSDPTACSAQGGPTISDRAGSGGAGNGQGGTGVTINVNGQLSSNPAGLPVAGAGSDGAEGFDVNTSTPGGAGGVVGAADPSVSVAGGAGGAGQFAPRTPSAGGGGGAGVYFATNAAANVNAATVITGGSGGIGGATNSSTGGAGGGGGGAGFIALADTFDLQNAGVIVGGEGGAGGGGGSTGFGGGGGGGGDGLLLFGNNATINNNGSIVGGTGGAAGTGFSVNGIAGNSGAGINAIGTDFTLTNQASAQVIGGAATGTSAAGVGVHAANGGAHIDNFGLISGGIGAAGTASAIFFAGDNNQLTAESGSTTEGVVEIGSASSASILTLGNSALNGVLLDGLGAALQLNLPGGTLDIGGAITGSGDVASAGSGSLVLRGVDLTGDLALGHTGNTQVSGLTRTTGLQSFAGPVMLTGDSQFTSIGQAITFNGTVDGAHAITVSTPGATALSFSRAVGGTAALTDFTTSSGTFTAGAINAQTANITTHNGPITQTGIFDISGASSFNAGARRVTLLNANAFGGPVSVVGIGIDIHSASDMNVGAVANPASSGDLSFSSDGVLTVTPLLTTSGNITLASNGGVLEPAGALTSGGAISLTGDTGVVLTQQVTAGNTLTVNSDHGGLAQSAASISAATLVANTLGDVSLTSAGNAIDTLGNVNAANFLLADSSALTVSGNVTANNVDFNDSLGVLVTGSITTPGILNINAGTPLTVGNGGTTGRVSGDITDNGVLAFNRSDTVSFTGALDGSGQLVQKGSGTLLFDGSGATFAGTTQVQAGKLTVGSAAGSGALLGGSVNVASGAGLGGHGRIAGSVAMANGSILSPGNSIGTLTVDGDLTMAQGTIMDAELGASGTGDQVAVGGNLNLQGVTLNLSDAGGMGPGVYTLFSYGGNLTQSNGGLGLGTVPTGHLVALQYLNGSKLINLLDLTGTSLSFWNANGLASASQMGGGTGTWSTTSANWTDSVGTVTGAMNPQPGFAIFGGAPGTVTIDNGPGQVAATGMQFNSDGYRVVGGPIQLVTTDNTTPVIRVGDGGALSAGYTATIDAGLTGTQGIAKNDAGTLVLTGNNTYTGDTVINGGVLSVAADANLGNAANGVTLQGGALRVTGNAYSSTGRALSLTTGGALDIADASNTFAWDGAIAGAGVLEKLGAGTLALNHANAYTGGTKVTAGTLRLGDSGAIGSGTLSLASGSTLDLAANGLALTNATNVTGAATVNVDGSISATLGGVIADGASAGALTKTGTGELQLTANNAYTGPTTIAAGTLHVGDGGTQGAIAGDVVDHAALVLDRSDNVTYGATLSGEGAFSKLGGGTLHLTGNSSAFTGTAKIAAGALQLDGSLGGALSMASGTLLTGTGTGGSLALQSGAEVSPGGQGVPATLSFTGDLNVAAGSRYTVDVTDAGQGDRIAAAGHATLQGGSVVSLGTGGNWGASSTYTILSAASGVTGTFAGVSSNLAFLTPSLAYTANDVNLTLSRNEVAFPDVGITRNERATAGATEALGAGTAVYDTVLRLDAPAARAAFDSLSDEIQASTRTAIADDQRYQREAINNHLLNADAASDGRGVSAWASTWGHWGNYDGDGNAARTSANGGGLLVGADTVVGQTTRVGFAVGTGQVSVSTPARDSSADVRTRTAGIYAGGREGAIQWQAGALYGQENIRTHRTVTVGDLSGRVSSDDDAHAAQGYVEAAYVFEGARGSWAPFVNVAYQQLRTPSIREHGAFGALDIDADRSTQTFGTLGLRGEAKLGDGGTALFGSVGWRHASGDVDSTSRMRFDGSATSFDIQGVPIADNAGIATAGLRFRPAANVVVDATYSGQFAKEAKDQSARVSVAWMF
jgi:fibronectin-binding autotransporter adhesin